MHEADLERGGALRKADTGRWDLNDIELTCGSRFQVYVQGHWIDVAVEHDGGDYYAFPLAIRLHVGLRARFPGQWGD
jgi:hypothetical protein